jgi:hypothetical protein
LVDEKQPAANETIWPAKGIVKTIDGDGISTEGFQDIGRWTVFPEHHWRRMFPRKAFGRIEETDYAKNKTFGLQTREEGLRLTNELRRLTLPSERNIPYQEIVTWDTAQVKEELLQDELKYTNIQQDISLSLLDYIETFQGEEKISLKHFFMPPGVFDGLVNVLVQQLTKKPMRPHIASAEGRRALIHQLVTVMRAKMREINHEARDFSEIIEALPVIKLKLRK